MTYFITIIICYRFCTALYWGIPFALLMPWEKEKLDRIKLGKNNKTEMSDSSKKYTYLVNNMTALKINTHKEIVLNARNELKLTVCIRIENFPILYWLFASCWLLAVF